ncbi:mitochondrial intermediate peptidase [Spathaspora passalidarum NRRL Y-27907]|uniref:Mitochondrial intermediate peptidase n=1 Tax=Spathaspora passalidarum (strain NRRL Y-27907 / 11-Y1) TaxID=619300 RepID=G3ATQ2_SPAPN|nr:mitochondrial intermediate peptidase [Spathaspora passalidarum NRRL Y-27907]EGW30278.1 mitochondrial intermediate peptidase [Spathaspora passalidarum NRRL Y-27907]
MTQNFSFNPFSDGSAYTHLRKVFDDQKYYNNFLKSSSSETFLSPRSGLFRNKYLSTPNGLVEFSKTSLKNAKALVEEMVNDKSSTSGKLQYIKKLDQLSDLLCRVIDMAEFVRVAHPGHKWVNAAQQTHEIMYEFMNQLNTNVELYSILRDILEDPSIVSQLSDEEVKVGEYLRQDFERSGIHMDPKTRDNFVKITQHISVLGSHFNNEMQNLDNYWCAVSTEEFDSIEDDQLKREILAYQSNHTNIKEKDTVYIPVVSHIPYTILGSVKSENIRRKIWVALHSSPRDQIDTLDKFITYRAILAEMLGYQSFAHYQLEHKMAKTPENVVAFLSNLQKSLLEHGVIKELTELYQCKPDAKPNATANEIIESVKPWDRDYLLTLLQQKQPDTHPNENISDYLSIGTIIAGLSKLFECLYQVEFVPVATSKDETWDYNQVRKLEVRDQTTKRPLGFLYLDFWSNKVHPSHFTIVCSRRLNNEPISEMSKIVQLDGDYQLPVISLICNFPKPFKSTIGRFAGIDNSKPTLLNLDQVDTLFHEMGHAMHSMLGRTELHNLSGTRCATDFVELPSVLMESFSKDPRILCEIARHYETDKPLPRDLLDSQVQRKGLLDASETYMQSKMAMLDQKLHSADILQSTADYSSTEVYHNLEAQLKVFSDQESTWHGKFPHLFSYGAVYYSYLLDRAIAEKIWNALFKEDPWSRAAGEKLRNRVLKWGGVKDPWECLGDLLDDDDVRKGDERSMETIARA